MYEDQIDASLADYLQGLVVGFRSKRAVSIEDPRRVAVVGRSDDFMVRTIQDLPTPEDVGQDCAAGL